MCGTRLRGGVATAMLVGTNRKAVAIQSETLYFGVMRWWQGVGNTS